VAVIDGSRARRECGGRINQLEEGPSVIMAIPQLQELLEAGVHFGHQTRRWNPKMRRFIFAERSGIYIIDLQKTLRQIAKAQEVIRSVVSKGEGVLFVCTKRQLKGIVQSSATESGSYFVTERWLGGMLTNFQTVKKQIRRLRDLEQGAAEGDFEIYTKKEKLLFEREREKLSRNLEGIKMMSRLPGVMFVVDAKKEKIAVAEANKLGIPVVAIVDTNADPDVITVPIPGNDDAIRSVALIAGALCDVIKEARMAIPQRSEGGESEETYSSEGGEGGDRGGDDRNKARRPRRRAKPEAVAARLKDGEAPAE
jgi:small subunit ribosomal protein S2